MSSRGIKESRQPGTKPVAMPQGMCGVHLMAWVVGRGCALNGKGWRSPFQLTSRVLRAFRLGWLSQRLGVTLDQYGLRKRWAERRGERWNRNRVQMIDGVKTRDKILAILAVAAQPVRVTDLAQAMRRTMGGVHQQLQILREQGKVVQVGKRYTLAREDEA